MKFKLKMIAVAAALASLAGGAQADITTQATNNGNLVLTVFNTVNKAWYIRDLGFTIDTFLPNGILASVGNPTSLLVGNKTPEGGLVLNAGNTANFSDASWSTWYNAQTSTNLLWAVSAGDTLSGGTNGVVRMITSSANLGETASNSNVSNFTGSSNYGSGQTFFNPATLSNFDLTGANPYQASLDTNFTLGADGLATIGQNVGLFYFSRNTGTSGAAATGGAFGNSLNTAVVSLAANGDFSYTQVAAVPLPAAAWMMGAGLMALGGVIRRRKAAAQA